MDSYARDTLTGIPVASQEFATLVLGPQNFGTSESCTGFGGFKAHIVGIGYMVGILFQGVVLSQYYNYLSSPSAATESKRVKWLCAVVVLLNVVQTLYVFNPLSCLSSADS